MTITYGQHEMFSEANFNCGMDKMANFSYGQDKFIIIIINS